MPCEGLTGGTCEHKWLAVEEDFDITSFCETWWYDKNQWETLLPGYETKVKSFNLRDEGIAPQPESLPRKKKSAKVNNSTAKFTNRLKTLHTGLQICSRITSSSIFRIQT